MASVLSRTVLIAFCSLAAVNSFTFVANSPHVRPQATKSFMATISEDTAAARAKAAMEAEAAENQQAGQTVGKVGIKDNKLMDLGGRPFPLSMIVGQENIKQALLLAAVNYRMGGLSSREDRLSTLILRESGDFTKADLMNGGIPLEERETEIIPTPFVQVPLNVMEDRLIGSADLEESVRSGISLRYPCRPLIATFNPEEAQLRDHLLDRIAIALSADAIKLDLNQRVEAVDSVINFSASGAQGNVAGEDALKIALANEEDLKTAIIFAREYIKDLKVAPSQIQYLCEEAIRAGCQGHRAEIFACEVARAAAALEGRQVTSEDLRLAVKLAIAPRGTFINTPMDQDEMMPPPPPPPPPPPQQNLDEQKDDQDEKEEEEEERTNQTTKRERK
ncbi:magnesium chelatase subunit D [Fragilaria crotonensis]|nr:magnesium chelatase subunit D [Fragilaria crotonensis]